MSDHILEMRHITKEFPGVKALDDVSLEVRRGEIHALVGENGAGKSTLMNVLSGIYPFGSYTGEIVYDGKVCHFQKIRDSEKAGIVIIHQELALVPYLSIAENMFLGNERGSAVNIDWNETYAKADELLAIVGLKESSHTLIKDLGIGKQQLVEIAKALSKNVKLLILDEPTASLNESDSMKLLNLLKDFKSHGVTSIIISHKLNEIAYVADQITIIRDGAVIETLDMAEEQADEARIIRGMVGRELTNRFPKRESHVQDEVVLEVENWSVQHALYSDLTVVDDVSFKLKKGEVVGIAGLMGAGRTEFAMSIFGKSYGNSIRGTLKIHGKEVVLANERDAIKHGLAYVTEDRKGNGLILSNPIRVNTTLARLDKVSHHHILDLDLEYKVAGVMKEKLGVKSPSVEQNVGNLSGGNQQKVLLAKWMFAEPDIMILDEPTRGIDVGAKYEIYCIINDLVAAGKSVVLISSEMPEVLGMCDRIYVMSQGKIVGEMDAKSATQERIMSSILSVNKGA
ncbi:MAG: ABC transporter ATP-binding protein [Firmicutes bacterium HGW-Firmicutes-9]|jgi:putative multiple sugar transport system ATP-binding protein|nr:MAG: ABC transporter ATP-binding protein [Firmicutes bacterium HGW-Firmicutes-9]